jgi:hypothetical protein
MRRLSPPEAVGGEGGITMAGLLSASVASSAQTGANQRRRRKRMSAAGWRSGA